ncbi:hypothetical protein KUTeg_021215 [Tegillarca granosa]|uniref:FCH domain-containing protein n=1 Tax=Tegillarca granosa TaxID=220873 RepID=A0ABQ9EA65_TEGGR|nr:hypothetical protein KUTeg_021215 [Tegillarca granosa]
MYFDIENDILIQGLGSGDQDGWWQESMCDLMLKSVLLSWIICDVETNAVDFEVSDIRNQLNEQLRCMESRLEVQIAMVTEIQDFFRKKAEIEMEYARNLEKLVKQTKLRHRQEKQKCVLFDHVHLIGIAYDNINTLLDLTKKESRDHSTVSDLSNNQMVQKLADIMENAQRIFRAVRTYTLV